MNETICLLVIKIVGCLRVTVRCNPPLPGNLLRAGCGNSFTGTIKRNPTSVYMAGTVKCSFFEGVQICLRKVGSCS